MYISFSQFYSLIRLFFTNNADRLSFLGPTLINIDLGLEAAFDISLAIVVLGLSGFMFTLMDSDSTITLRTLVNDSMKIVEISRLSAELVEIVNITSERRTKDIQESSQTTASSDTFFGVKNEGTSIFLGLSWEETATADDITIKINSVVGDFKFS